MSGPADGELWEVYFDPADARILAHDERFHALLAFARSVNVIRVSLEDLSRDLNARRPEDRRRHSESLFRSASVLNEVKIAGERLGRWYRPLPEYSALIAVWKGDPLARPPLDRMIDIRDMAVAHFDPQMFAEALARETDVGRLRWASGQGRAMGAFYYELANDLVISYALGYSATEAEYWRKFNGLVDAWSALLMQIHEAAAMLIAAVTKSMGARVRRL